jgi:Sap, sulfolipid-1-addressing protein
VSPAPRPTAARDGNPGSRAVGVAAAVAIASAGLSTGQQVGAIAVYVLVAVLGVAAPLVVTLAMGEKAQTILDSWKAWLGQNNPRQRTT